MQSIAWTSLPVFYNIAWSTMPFNTMADAQEFVDLLVSRTRYRVWALAIDRQHANPDDRANDLDDEWCRQFRLELVGASYLYPF